MHTPQQGRRCAYYWQAAALSPWLVSAPRDIATRGQCNIAPRTCSCGTMPEGWMVRSTSGSAAGTTALLGPAPSAAMLACSQSEGAGQRWQAAEGGGGGGQEGRPAAWHVPDGPSAAYRGWWGARLPLRRPAASFEGPPAACAASGAGPRGVVHALATPSRSAPRKGRSRAGERRRRLLSRRSVREACAAS